MARPVLRPGYTVIKKTDYDSMGAEQVMEVIDETIGDRPLYITFDLDCLDPMVAPGWPTSRRASKGSASIR